MRLNKIKTSVFTYLISGVLVGLLVLILFIKPKSEDRLNIIEHKSETYMVEKVLDGDTIRLSNQEVVRLIGVDTPESNHSEVPVQLFSQEASKFTKQLCEGFKVRLDYDEQRKDKYNRTLAYVYLEDGRMVNEELIKRGYAYVMRRFPFEKKEEFLKLQKRAQDEQRGLWSLNLSSGRLANIASKFDSLSEEGKREFDKELDVLLDKYGKTDCYD